MTHTKILKYSNINDFFHKLYLACPAVDIEEMIYTYFIKTNAYSNSVDYLENFLATIQVKVFITSFKDLFCGQKMYK